MKRTLALVFSIIFALFAFAGCGDDKSSKGDVQLSSILADINDNGNLSDMKTITNSTDLQKQFDINPEDVSDFIAEVSKDGSFPTAIVVTKATNEDDVQAVEDKLNAYLNSTLSTAQSYAEEQVATIKECTVQNNGLYSMLVIAENHSDLEKIIQSYF